MTMKRKPDEEEEDPSRADDSQGSQGNEGSRLPGCDGLLVLAPQG
jgi:hypothetical protein